MISIIIVAEFVEKERQTVLVTPEKVTKIVTNALDNNLALEWARLLFKLKEDSKSAFVTAPGGLSFEEAWQTRYGASILGEFKGWCRQLINLHRTVPLPVKAATAQGGARGSSSSSSANPVKASVSSSAYKCPLCGGSHSDRRGRPRKYLAACNSFIEQAINQRWNTIRKLKHCQVCTSGADHGRYGENCTLKRLACKSCNPDKPHHTLLCSKETANTAASSSAPPDSSDKGGAKPKRSNRSKKKSSKGSSNSNLPQVSYADGDSSSNTKRRPDFSVFAERLLLLLHTLHSLSTSSLDASFKAKCQNHLKDDWYSRPLILQCCMQVKLNLQERIVSCISLSDNGSTL